MSEPMPDWDAIAGEIDEKSPARHFGDLNRLRDENRLGRYLVIYEFTDSKGRLTLRSAWSHNEHLWALGAASHAEMIVSDSWNDCEDEDG